MPGLTPSLRARPCNVLWWTAMLFVIAGLAATGSESVSFGHRHLAGGHALHHHHFHFGSHEHTGEHRHHGHEAPAPRHRETPKRTATVSAAPALGPPVGATVLLVPLAESAPVELSLVLPAVMRPASRLASPRAPPTSLAVPDCLR